MSFYFTDLLLEAGNLLGRASSEKDISDILVKYINSALKPDLICFYQKEKLNRNFHLTIKRGFQEVPGIIQNETELSVFLSDSKELVCLNSRKKSPFSELLLTNSMNSGMAISILINNKELGIIIVNSYHPFYFKSKDLSFLENLISILTHNNLNRSLK